MSLHNLQYFFDLERLLQRCHDRWMTHFVIFSGHPYHGDARQKIGGFLKKPWTIQYRRISVEKNDLRT